MAGPVFHDLSGASGWRRSGSALVALAAVALCGCSINLGSLSSDSGSDPPKPAAAVSRPAPDDASVGEARTHTEQGQTLARSGNTEQALTEFDKALDLDPHNAQALYDRGLLYQGEKQHQLAIDDLTAANGLTPLRAEPLLARAVSYLALDMVKEAAADLDEAAQADPHNAQVWTTRGQAYERLGDKTKAAGSYARALGIRPRDEVARTGFARVGGKADQSYEPF